MLKQPRPLVVHAHPRPFLHPLMLDMRRGVSEARLTDCSGALVSGNGDLIACLTDLSPYVRTGTQTNSGQRPTYRTNTAALGGAAWRFDGSNDALALASAINLIGSFELWAVVSLNTAGAGFQAIFGNNATTNGFFGITPNNGTNGLLQLNLGGATQIATGSTFSTSTKYIVNVTRTGSTLTFYVNNSQHGSTATSVAALPLSQIGLRGSVNISPLNADISALQIFARNFSSSERTDKYNELNSLA